MWEKMVLLWLIAAIDDRHLLVGSINLAIKVITIAPDLSPELLSK